MTTGMNMGFTSSFLTAIQAPDSDVKMDKHTASWFASVFMMSGNIGFVLGALMMSRFGRKPAFIVTSIPSIIGLVITYFASNTTHLMIGRVLNGISFGGSIIVGVVYIGECTSPHNRGMYLNMVTGSLNIGSLLVHVVGHYVTWRTLSLVTCIPNLISIVIALTWSESPSWLAEKKKFIKSRQSFYWLRGRTEETTKEIEELIRTQNDRRIEKTIRDLLRDFCRKFKKRSFLMPLRVIIISLILEESGGRHIFPTYGAQIVKEIMVGGFNKFYYQITIDIVIVCSGLAATFLIRIIKMRVLLFTTGTATLITLSLASLTLFLVKTGKVNEDYGLASLVLFGIYFALSNLGCTCVPLMIRGEIFPLEHKVVASLATYFFATFIASVILKIMPFMVSAFYIYGTFLVLALLMGLSLLILYFILPETKDRTLLEIENDFTSKDDILVPTDEKNDEFEEHMLSRNVSG